VFSQLNMDNNKIKIKEGLDKILKYTHLLAREEISILEISQKANEYLDIISILAKEKKEFFLKIDLTKSEVYHTELVNMMVNFNNMNKYKDDNPTNTDNNIDSSKEVETEETEETLTETEAETQSPDIYKDKYVRLYADFENFKKRVNKEKSDIKINTKYNVLNSFLDIIDDLELAKATLKNSKNVFENSGLDIILSKLDQYLESQDITEVDTTGKFNEDIHECLTVLDLGTDKSGDIIEVIKKGYMIDGKIVRYPKVVIGR